MIVVGHPALDALTAEARKFALFPPDLSKTDFAYRPPARATNKPSVEPRNPPPSTTTPAPPAGASCANWKTPSTTRKAATARRVRSTRQPRTDIGRRRAQVPRGNRSWTVPKKARVHIELNPTRKRRRSSENRPPETPKAMRHKKRRGVGAGQAEERRQEPRSGPQPGHMVTTRRPPHRLRRPIRPHAPGDRPGANARARSRRPGDGRVARGVRRGGEAEREAAREGARRGLTSKRVASLGRVPGSRPSLPRAPLSPAATGAPPRAAAAAER